MASTDTTLPTFDPDAVGADRNPEETPTYPALVSLNTDQRALVEAFVADGFADRRDLILWLHTLQWHTLGRIPWGWYFDIVDGRTARAIVLTGEGRPATDISPETATTERRLLAVKYLRPACRAALRQLRTGATEYLEDEQPDPERAQSLALRPSLSEYHDQQQAMLEAWLDGFDDVDELVAWLHRLDRATLGCIADVERQAGLEFDYQLLENRTARRVALRAPDGQLSEAGAAWEREQMAARYLLPATNLSCRILTASSGEAYEHQPEDSSPAQL